MNTSLGGQANLRVVACYGISPPDKSCGREDCDSENIFLTCHVTFREHMFKGLYEIMSGSPHTE